MGCAAFGSNCAEPAIPPYCCDDMVCVMRNAGDYNWCMNPDSAEDDVEEDVGIKTFRPLPENRVSGFHPEEGVSGLISCQDDDAGLMKLAKKNGFYDVSGCAEVVGDWCENDKLAALCPATCSVQSGCDGSGTLAAKANMQTEAIGDIATLEFALAVVGSIAIVATVFSRCTRKSEYKTVVGNESSEQSEEI